MNRLRAAYGLVLLVDPDLFARILLRRDLSAAASRIARVLGIRHVAQAVLTERNPATTVRRFGAAADALHGLSMVAAAGLFPSQRRLALADSCLAFGFAAVGARVR